MAKIKLAIFDIDGTIFRSSLLIELVRGLVSAGIFPKKTNKEIKKEYLAWLDRTGHYHDYLDKIIEIHTKYLDGRSVGYINSVVEDVIDEHKDRVYRFTRDLIKELKKGGYYLVTISGSPEYMVSAFARYMDFDRSFGAVYEIKNNRFTGRILNKDSAHNKSKVLDVLMKELNNNIDFDRSIAVGDTETDIPMLNKVGRPIAFNPNTTLAAYAKKKKWEVVVERKDVIYGIKDFEFLNKK